MAGWRGLRRSRIAMGTGMIQPPRPLLRKEGSEAVRFQVDRYCY